MRTKAWACVPVLLCVIALDAPLSANCQDDLVGLYITKTPKRGKSWITIIWEVLERTDRLALVRDSGRPRKEN